MTVWKCFKSSIYSRSEDFLLFEVPENSAEGFCAWLTFAEQTTLLCINIADEWERIRVATWGIYCPVYAARGCCQEAGEGGGGPLGSSPREYVGFPIAVLGDGSLLPPSATLNAQLLPYIFFLPLPTSAADSLGEQGATHTQALRRGSGRVCAEICFGHWAFQVKLLAACRGVEAPPLAHHPAPPFPSSVAHTSFHSSFSIFCGTLRIFTQCIP